jgi:hypothetical protein
MFQPKPRGEGFLPRIGTGLRNLGPPALGLATAISSMSTPPPSQPEMGYPPTSVASTQFPQFPPIVPTTPTSFNGDDALPLSNTTLSGDPDSDAGYTTEEAELRAEVERILEEAKEKRKKDAKERQEEEEASETSDSSDDVVEDDEVEVADAGGAALTPSGDLRFAQGSPSGGPGRAVLGLPASGAHLIRPDLAQTKHREEERASEDTEPAHQALVHDHQCSAGRGR